VAQLPYRFNISPELWTALDQLRDPAANWDEVVPGGFFLTDGWVAAVLAPDGRVFANDEGPWYEVTTESQACLLVACGIDDYASSDLEALFPKRPVGALDCKSCGGSGRDNNKNRWPCGACGSLGWVRKNVTYGAYEQ
jgi:hypothetical protein